MQTRKIQKVGERSFSVSLPKEWVLKNNLKSQDLVFISEQESDKLVISASEKQAKKRRELNVNLSKIKSIKQFIVLCYMKNVDKINFKLKDSTFNQKKYLKQMVGFLEGYDIVHEDGDSIIVSFLFHDFTITVKQVIKRIVYLLKYMVDSLEQNEIDSVRESEVSVDRLNLLSKRLIFLCINDMKVRTKNGFSSVEEIFFFRNLINKLESIADCFFDLSKMKLSSKVLVYLKQIVVDIMDWVLKNNFPPAYESRKFIGLNVEEAIIFKRLDDQLCDLVRDLISIDFDDKYF